MISSLVPLHDSCKRGIKLQKEIVGLHSPLHTIHYISKSSFKTSQPDYGWRSKRKIPKQHKATGQDRILVETTTDHRKRHKQTATIFIGLPGEELIQLLHQTRLNLHLGCWSNCEPQRTQQSRSRVTRLFKPWVWTRLKKRICGEGTTRVCSSN